MSCIHLSVLALGKNVQTESDSNAGAADDNFGLKQPEDAVEWAPKKIHTAHANMHLLTNVHRPQALWLVREIMLQWSSNITIGEGELT